MAGEIAPHTLTLTSPNGYIATSSTYYTGGSQPTDYIALHAFDGTVSNYWAGSNSGVDWLQIDLGGVTVSGYGVQMSSVGGAASTCPKNWTLQGSNDGSTWTTLDTQTNQTGWSAAERRDFTLGAVSAQFRYIRLNITANNGNTLTQVGELYIQGTAVVSPADFGPHNMTSDTLPVPLVASATSEYSIYQAYKSFSATGSGTSGWLAALPMPQSITLDLGPGNGKVLYGYSFWSGSTSSARAVTAWTLYGSNDGTTWTALDARSGATYFNTALYPIGFSAPTSSAAYRYFRFTVTANNGDLSLVGIDQIYLFGVQPPPPNGLWLTIANTPGTNTDQTRYMSKSGQHNFTLSLKQRGQASVDLYVPAGDNYAPTRLTQLYLFDETSDGYILVFAGLIQDIQNAWLGTSGDRMITCSVVSFESIFDTVYATPTQYQSQTCGYIVNDLLSTFEAGSLVAAGSISAGVTIPLYQTNFETVSQHLTALATASQFTWKVIVTAIGNASLFFGAPSALPAPFTISNTDIQWETANWKVNGADYRNRQAVRLSQDAFAHSKEFFVGAGQTTITLLRPCNQVVAAWATLSTQNSATGTCAGIPVDGDTFTIGLANATWQANHVYAVGGVIIDPAGHIQKVTGVGGDAKSGAVQPVWNDTGGTTTDNHVVWTDQGPYGLGAGQETYTWKNTIDNTQFGQILIGGSVSDCILNAIYAIAANEFYAGTKFSLPTWENSNVNAAYVSGGTMRVSNKSAGTSYVSSLSSTGSGNFTWSAFFTSGGTSPQGSLGPGYGATISLNVGVVGSAVAAPGIAYTPGSAILQLSSPLNVGSNLNVEYTRVGGDVIQCENTSLVTALAALTGGTGKYQAITSGDSSTIKVSAASGLLMCQQALAAYSTPPEEFTFQTYRAGLFPGQELSVAITKPVGAGSYLNGTNKWIIQEVSGELVPILNDGSFPLGPHCGHYRYTIRCANIQEIGSYLDFWQGQGGGGGTSTAPGIIATNGGGTNVPPQGIALETNGTANGSQTTLNLIAGAGVTVTDGGTGGVTIASAGFSGTAVCKDPTGTTTVTLTFVNGVCTSVTTP
jgi:hypothetical protein